jgi:hypothetical protein
MCIPPLLKILLLNCPGKQYNNTLKYKERRKVMIEKNEVVAHVIMEQTADPCAVNVRDYSRNGMTYVIFETIFQSFGVKNRNKRIYDGDAVMASWNAPHIQELIRKKSFVSEYGHPLDQSMSRVTQIDPARVCGRINSYYRSGNLLKGEFETFDDGACGTMLTRRILQGLEPAFSVRMLAKLSRTQDGTMLMNQPGHLVTADCVILPSHCEAYRDESKAMNVVHKAITESAGADITEEQYRDMVFAINESMFTDFIKEESTNFKLVRNVEEVIGDSFNLTKDLNNIIIKEGSNTYYVKVEDKIKHDIRNFMSKF